MEYKYAMPCTTRESKEFAERLKEYRMERCWTLEQLAATVGLTASAVSKIERGLVKPHDLTVAKITKCLPMLNGGEE